MKENPSSRRVMDWRADMVRQGWRSKTWLFSPATLAALARLKKESPDASEQRIVEAAIVTMAKAVNGRAARRKA